MQLLDVRMIRRPPRYIQTRNSGQVLLNATEEPIAGMPVFCDLRSHAPIQNLIFDNTDSLLHGPDIAVLKTVSALDGGMRTNGSRITALVERFYAVSARKRYGRLFRVLYANSDRSYANNRVVMSSKDRSYIDPYAHLIMSFAKAYVPPETLADLYLDAVVSTRCCETWFSPIPMMANLSHLLQSIHATLNDPVFNNRREREFIQILRETPNYKSIKPYDYITWQHSQQIDIPISDITMGFMGPLIDSSPCPSLYPTTTSAPYINNLSVFGSAIERIMEYRVTDFRVRARFPANEMFCVKPSYVDYVVDRTLYSESDANHTYLFGGGLTDSEIDLVFKLYLASCGVMSFGHDVILIITKTYDEEITFEFEHASGRKEVYYFDLNACTLLSPDVCVNRITHNSPFPILPEAGRDIDRWL